MSFFFSFNVFFTCTCTCVLLLFDKIILKEVIFQVLRDFIHQNRNERIFKESLVLQKENALSYQQCIFQGKLCLGKTYQP